MRAIARGCSSSPWIKYTTLTNLVSSLVINPARRVESDTWLIKSLLPFAGRCIPFGRSMIYRFAVISTFSFLPFAFDESSPETSLPKDYPLQWGHIKGLVLRHLRFWGKQKDIFRSDGTLNIGYLYENMNMTENYNGFGESSLSSQKYI